MEYSKYNIDKGAFTYYVIKPKGKGSVPVALRGMYTSVEEAKKAIDFQDEVSKNGKAGSSN